MIELLIPAQNKKSIQAASQYADAFYFGTEAFNMRIHAKNIKLDGIKDMVNLCHDNNCSAFLTTNIIIYEGEIELLHSLMEQAHTSDVDAVIVHDFAAIKIAKELGIPFHVSTQASVSNSSAAAFYEELGAERIIMARELSLEQIAEISKKMTKAKVEAFIHGAMCTSISGRCYFSQTLCDSSEYSANRGKCMQPCRRQWKVLYEDGQEFDYDGYYFINAKDLCMIEFIPELFQAGIESFKIEGRMRSPKYIETAARVYRTAIDTYQDNSFTTEKAQEWKKELGTVYNRGFSTGFYFQKPTAIDVSRQKSGNQATTKKISVGKVISYYRKQEVAKIFLQKGRFKIGDTIYFEGTESGYVELKLKEMKHKNKLVTETPDVTNIKDGYLLTVKLNKPVKQGDRVFIYS